MTMMSINIQMPVPVTVQMPWPVKVGHLIYTDSNGRYHTKCFNSDCKNPECVIRAVHDT